MNLIKLLSNELMSKSTIQQVAQAGGIRASQAEKVIGNAIPLLVQSMSDNAGTKEGAESLFAALGEHKNGVGAAQLADVDTVDGDKIVSHIFGENKDGITKAIAKNAGVSKAKTGSILALLAPILMSLISTEVSSNNTSSGGLSSLLSLFTDDELGNNNAPTTSNSGFGDIGTAILLNSLLGGGNSGGNLMGALLGAPQQQSSGGLGGALLGSLLGGGQQQQQSSGLGGALLGSLLGSGQQQQQSSPDLGGSLLGSLFGGGSSGNYASDEQKEIARLKRELRDAQDALDVLKKAIGILGKD